MWVWIWYTCSSLHTSSLMNLLTKELTNGPMAYSFTGSNMKGTPVLSAQEVRDKILALNRPSAPYEIVDGASEKVDLIAEWKIVDAKWYEIFAKPGLTKGHKIYLKFDANDHEVRAQDHEYSVEWRAGVPTLSVQASAFRGQETKIEFGTAYAFTENLAPGQVYNYHFDTREIKHPLQEAVTSCGWTYKGVAFGKLRTT